MVVRRRYLRLEERCPGTEIPLMMCRVVLDPLLPLQYYRPRDVGPSPERRYSTKDIISDILPAPRKTIHGRLSANVENGHSFGAGLWSLFETELSKKRSFHEEIEAIEVSTYSLNNPASYFEELMEDASYAKDVSELLSASKQGLAYLVTGFMTGRGMKSRQSDSQKTGVGAKVTAPTSAAFAPGIGFGDPSFSTSRDNKTGHTAEGLHLDEEIFAVSYAIIKQPRKLGGLGKRDATAKSKYLAPRFATRSEAAFASGDDSDDEDLIAGLSFELFVNGDELGIDNDEKEMLWFEDN